MSTREIYLISGQVLIPVTFSPLHHFNEKLQRGAFTPLRNDTRMFSRRQQSASKQGKVPERPLTKTTELPTMPS